MSVMMIAATPTGRLIKKISQATHSKASSIAPATVATGANGVGSERAAGSGQAQHRVDHRGGGQGARNGGGAVESRGEGRARIAAETGGDGGGL